MFLENSGIIHKSEGDFLAIPHNPTCADCAVLPYPIWKIPSAAAFSMAWAAMGAQMASDFS